MVETTEQLSEAETAVYDRQIRLWGLDAQKRLRSADVLIAGLNGLGSEVCKNIVLAGVKSVVLLDHEVVTEEDASCQFLVNREDVGKNRAVSSQRRTQQLNPMVQVNQDTQPLSEKDEEFFKKFNVVCVIGHSLTVCSYVNNICHRCNIKFFCGSVYGFYGYSFTDLILHSYAEETKVSTSSGKKESDDSDTKMTKKEMEFPALDCAMAEFNTIINKICPSYYVFRVIMEFQETYGHCPKPCQSEEDSKLLLKLGDHILDKIGVPRSKLNDKFSKMVFGELSPVCAVVGGILAQEIIKAVSCKDAPIDNFFFFNGDTNDGSVQHFGST
ncbi:SUMO-activating enzyme subunit 1 [Nymphon striatum]|nr:SUMO-activating enzyme subunit 1 [Nymphon striatum]